MKEKILVTGSDGFVGTHLVGRLIELGYDIFTFDVVNGDISTTDLHFEKLDHIIHLASRTFVPDSWKNPFDFYRTNVLGTIKILDLCRKHGCSLTYVSSYIYGNPIYLPVDENHPVASISPYNHSKMVTEDICRFYSEQFQVPVTILRPVNLYGSGQNENFLIPSIIRQATDSSVLVIEVQDLRPKRDFLYIDDFVDVLISTIGRKSFDVFNIGSGYSMSVKDIIETVMAISGIKKSYTAKNTERKNEVWDVYMDISKANRILDWVPKTSFNDGIKKFLHME